MLKLAAMTTDLCSATDPLTSISSYYESKGERKDVWRRLYEVVATKETPTRTHRLIAQAAKLQLGVNTAEDYLIVTTNYDWLMEKALDELRQKCNEREMSPMLLVKVQAAPERRDFQYW